MVWCDKLLWEKNKILSGWGTIGDCFRNDRITTQEVQTFSTYNARLSLLVSCIELFLQFSQEFFQSTLYGNMHVDLWLGIFCRKGYALFQLTPRSLLLKQCFLNTYNSPKGQIQREGEGREGRGLQFLQNCLAWVLQHLLTWLKFLDFHTETTPINESCNPSHPFQETQKRSDVYIHAFTAFADK